MPYKDPEAKRQRELRRRTERLARRRELRRIQAAEPIEPEVDPTGAGVLLLPLLAGSALAAYSPKIAFGAGSLALLAATYYLKGWQWWLVGALTVLLALVFMKRNENREKKTK
jgi:hypothetical protein